MILPSPLDRLPFPAQAVLLEVVDALHPSVKLEHVWYVVHEAVASRQAVAPPGHQCQRTARDLARQIRSDDALQRALRELVRQRRADASARPSESAAGGPA